jgi:four helix bundle protein
MFGFEKLEVYQKAIEFANDIYELTKKFPKEELYGIVSQLRRAGVSVPINIAEGSGRSKTEFKHYLRMARISVYECIPLLQISLRQQYIIIFEYETFYEKCTQVAQMISALINSISKNYK